MVQKGKKPNELLRSKHIPGGDIMDGKSAFIVAVVVVYFLLSRLLYLAYSANFGLLCMPHPGMGPLV